MTQLALPGTATTADVLATKTFSSSAGFNATGIMPENGSPTLYAGQSITAGHYTGGSVSPIKVAYGSVTSSAGTATFNKLGGGTITANTATIPVPSSANQIIAVFGLDVTSGYSAYGSPLGYADGVDATALVWYVNSSCIAGGALQLSTSGIVIPADGGSQTINYTVYYT